MASVLQNFSDTRRQKRVWPERVLAKSVGAILGLPILPLLVAA